MPDVVERIAGSLESVAALPPTVTRLTLRNCADDGILDLSGSPELTSLVLEHNELWRPPLAKIVLPPQLRTVQIISDWAHVLVPKLPPSVTSLDLTMPNGGLPGVPPLPLDQVLPQLENLEVSCTEIEDCNLTCLPSTLRRISVGQPWPAWCGWDIIRDVAVQLAEGGANTTIALWGYSVFEVTPDTDDMDVFHWLEGVPYSDE